MAEAILSITGAWWGTGGSAVWTAADFIQSGNDNANYRSKLAISTAGLTIVNSSKLVVEVEVYSKSSPAGLEVILTQDNSIAANNCQNDNANAASDDLEAACIARSYAYADAAGTTLLGPTNGVDMAIGSKYYLVFDITSLKQNQTYYLYFIRCHHNGYTGSGWQEAYISNIVPTLTYANYTSCTAPTSFTATPNPFEDTVTLEWSGAIAGTSNPINGYLIQYDDSVDGVIWSGWENLKTVSITASSGAATDKPGIARGAYRRYRIQTQGVAGSSYYSEYSSVIPIVQKNRQPVSPTLLTVSATLIASGTEVTVSWLPGNDADGNISVYLLRRLIDGVWTDVYIGPDLQFAEILSGAEGSITQYAVSAYDVLGAYSDWTFSNTITFNSSPTAPLEVHLDKSEYSPGDVVTIFWSGAADVDNNLIGYDICYIPEGADVGVPTTTIRVNPLYGADGSGNHSFIPNQLEYHQKMQIAICSVDALGAKSGWSYSGYLVRNDNPYAYIHCTNGGAYVAGTDKHLVTIAEVAGDPSSFAKYMPYIFDGETWQRCIE